MFLTREDILSLSDITVKEIVVPSDIPEWANKHLFIRQLSRGQQDDYLRRQFGSIRMKQDAKARNQEVSNANVYGHDGWLVIMGVCTPDGIPLFTVADEKSLATKSGQAIGWIAEQIIEFSGMKEDVKSLENTEQALGNLSETQT